MIQEAEVIPYSVSKPPGEKVIVFAPHPDDETLGCGGTVRLLVEAGKKIKIIFLTSGDKADPRLIESGASEYALAREKEAERALRVLGVSDHEFLRFPDRGLSEEYGDVLRALLEIIRAFGPDTIYAPSMVELNPDHRTTAALALEIQRASYRHNSACIVDPTGKRPLRIAFYEVTTPLRPNALVDITSAYKIKMKAVKKYKSQLRLMNYGAHVIAMNTIRTLTVSGPRYVEAFWLVESPLNDEEIEEWLSYSSSLNIQSKGQGSS